MLEPQDKRRQSAILHEVLALQAKECDKQNLGIIFEFITPGTSQQNSVVERKIPTLMGRSRAMMLTAGFSQQDKRKFWCEVISTAT